MIIVWKHFQKKAIFKFKNHSAVAKHNILISGDFECILAKLDSGKKKNTVPIEVHIPISCGINIDRQDGQNKYFEYVGLDSARVFIEKIEEIAKNYLEEFGEPKPMTNIEEANEAVRKAAKCYICDLPCGNGNLVAVRDHDHNPGEFRGVAHSKCNLLLRRKKLLPVILHNLSGYDESLFFRELVLRDFVKIIPKNEENFISLSKIIEMGDKKIEIRFLDSFRFMSFSLAKLVEFLPLETFKNLRREFPEDEKFKLLCKKGAFPFGDMDSVEKLKRTSLPPFENWYNVIEKRFPTKEEFARSQKEFFYF